MEIKENILGFIICEKWPFSFFTLNNIGYKFKSKVPRFWKATMKSVGSISTKLMFWDPIFCEEAGEF